MKKKAEVKPTELVMVFVILLISVGVLLHIFNKSAGKTDDFLSKNFLAIEAEECLMRAERAYESGIIFADTDDDGYPDACDICFGATDSDGANNQDSDLDGMPDDCDSAPFDPGENSCEYIMWDYKKEKQFHHICCTPAAGASNPVGMIFADIYCKSNA